jgi:sugar lactone lactonase YvrE
MYCHVAFSSFFRHLHRAFFALTFLFAVAVCACRIDAQNLQFSPVIYGIEAVNSAQANNVNSLSGPNAVAVDPLGNLFIIDGGHSQIRKVDPTGTASIYAGKGASSYTGDNGPAIAATFLSPQAIVSDTLGNLYVADTGNYAIRRIDAASGVITTIAGGNGAGYTGDGFAATTAKLQGPAGLAFDSNGNLYFSDGAVVRRIDTNNIITTFAGGGTPSTGNGDGGVATSAKLISPIGLAVDDANNLYIVDSGAYQVRVVNTTNNIITTFAGTGVRSYTGDGGPAIAATFLSPRGIALDGAGNVFVADYYGYIREINSNNNISTLAGNANGNTLIGDGTPPTQATFNPNGVAADISGNVYFPVVSGNKIYKIVTHPERFPMTKVGLSSPSQRIILENVGSATITYTSLMLAGDFAIAPLNPSLSSNSPCYGGTGSHTISSGFGNYCTLDIVFTPTASGIRSFPATVASNDTTPTLMLMLTSTGMASTLATTGGDIFTIAGNYPATGVYGDGNLATASTLVQPGGLAIDSTGNIYFSESGYCRIRKIDAVTGILTTIAGINYANCMLNAATNQPDGPAAMAELYEPSAIAFDSGGNLYVGDSGHYQIRAITPAGQIVRVAGTGAQGCTFTGDGGLAIDAQFCSPGGIAVDKMGNIYFTDNGTHMIRKITASTGKISVLAGIFNTNFTGAYSADGPGTGMTLNRPWGLALDSTQTNLIFVENGSNIVRKLNLATDMVTTIAGNRSVIGYAGDGELATSATLNDPYGLTVDAANDIFITDSENSVIRKIDGSTGIITTVAGNFVQGGLYNGDGIPATSAGLNFPESVVVDAAGYLILSDRNPLIREVSPNGSLVFGNQLINTTSSSQTVTISNIGNTPMTFGDPAYAVSGDFAFVPGGTCTFTSALTPGSSCTVKLNFTPTATGARYGLLAYYDSGVASPQMTQLRGVGTAPAQPVGQTISLMNPGTKIYGSSSFSVTATATSGLPVTITVQSGPATISNGIVSVTGAGTVVLIANQAGNTFYLTAPAVTTSFTVSPAVLTVTPAAVSIIYGSAIPTSFATTITGFVNNDSATVVTGSAAVTTTATMGAPVASYPLTAAIGTLVATNYTFTFVPGTLNITQVGQRISFGNTSLTHTYGDAPFTVTATSDSGLPVTLTIKSGNATIANGVVTLTGIGQVMVLASQAGNVNYTAAASNTLSITVNRAVLTVTGQPASMVYGSSTLPPLSGSISGFVYGENISVVTGTASYSTTAGSTSAAGSYAIVPNVSGLSAVNYTFMAVNGALTVSPALLTITANAATRSYGTANPVFSGSVAGLKNADNPVVAYSSTAVLLSTVGSYPISAAISGASATSYTLIVIPSNLTITQAGTATGITTTAAQINVLSSDTFTAVVTTLVSGTPTGTVTFYDNGTTSIGSSVIAAGIPLTFSTALAGGVHQITAHYSGDTNFSASTSAPITVTVGDYNFTATPSTFTIVDGQSATTSITFTPSYGWSGTQSLGCVGLKTGENCSFSPASITSTGSNASLAITLTISTTALHASMQTEPSGHDGRQPRMAYLLALLPLAFVMRRKRWLKNISLCLLVFCFLFAQTGCGSSSPSSTTNPNGTPTGAGTISVSLPGADASHQLALNVTIN